MQLYIIIKIIYQFLSAIYTEMPFIGFTFTGFNIITSNYGIKHISIDFMTFRACNSHIFQFSKLLKNKKLMNITEKLSSRIRYGVKKELLKFVNLKGIGRVRARILYKNGIMSLNQLFETPNRELENLSNLLSHNLINSIKSQIQPKRTDKNKNEIFIDENDSLKKDEKSTKSDIKSASLIASERFTPLLTIFSWALPEIL